MRAFKVSIVLLILLFLLPACGFFSNDDSNLTAENRSLISQRDKARAELKKVQEQYIQQNIELTTIMEELNLLANRTDTLQLTFEGIPNPLTQAEEIEASIESIKSRLSFLSEDYGQAEGVIRNLQSMIERQEAEIISLKNQISEYEAEILHMSEVIAGKDEEISNQESTIAKQQERITIQQTEISKKDSQIQEVAKQRVEQMFDAGYEFERLADDEDNILNLSGRKNKLNAQAYKLSIYYKALFLYEIAAGEGHKISEHRISIVKDKISDLESRQNARRY